MNLSLLLDPSVLLLTGDPEILLSSTVIERKFLEASRQRLQTLDSSTSLWIGRWNLDQLIELTLTSTQ